MMRMLLVHPIRFVRDALEVSFHHSGFEIVAGVRDVENAVTTVRTVMPDVVLLAAVGSTPLGVRGTRLLAQEPRPAPIVVCGIPNTDADIMACLEAGASGYVVVDASLRELTETLQAAARHEVLVPPRLAALLCRRLQTVTRLVRLDSLSDAVPLTAREREVATLLSKSLSNKEIAVRLGIEPQTVKNHVHSILEKSRAHSRHEIARKLGIGDFAEFVEPAAG
jgi:DNA-binding NarL/FixJ family response regulator